jgi:spermidine synthase
MQQWFSQTNPGVSPYRLYALSNVGSLLALLSYPLYFEVHYPRQTQAAMWSVGLGLFVIFCGYCALKLWRGAPAPAADGAPAPAADEAAPAPISAVDKLLWVALPMIASILLTATTNKLSQEVAVIPFLWVLPLSLYLITFIVCFDHARWYHRGVFTALAVLGIAAACQLMQVGNDAPMKLQIVAYTAALFIACMVCHGELYRLKPPPRQLTAYFLLIALGGALGGFFVAIVAPAIFSDYRELQLGLWLLSYALGVLCFRHRSRELALAAGVGLLAIAAGLPALRALFDDSPGLREEYVLFFKDRWIYITAAVAVLAATTLDWRRFKPSAEWTPRMGSFAMALSVGLGAFFVVTWEERSSTRTLSATRNFYGTLKVLDYYPGDAEDNYHLLLHGATTHGLQFTKPEKALIATTYYAETSGVGLAINALPEGPRRLGLVGLGTGSLCTYGRKGDYLRIYEINPDVITLARTHFKYLDYCQAEVEIELGDARLVMEREVEAGKAQRFDLLALDAFSSDAIPVHLLTKEAFALYLQQIKPGGVIAVHISNRYLDLEPVVRKLAAHYNLHVATVSDDDAPDWWVYSTTWMLVTANPDFLAHETIKAAAEPEEAKPKDLPLWTDDFASLYAIMKQ